VNGEFVAEFSHFEPQDEDLRYAAAHFDTIIIREWAWQAYEIDTTKHRRIQ